MDYLVLDEEWHDWMYTVHRSIIRRRRKESYERERGKVKNGYALVACCEFRGTSEQSTIVIESFDDYDRLLDKRKDPRDPVIRVRFRSEPEATQRMAS